MAWHGTVDCAKSAATAACTPQPAPNRPDGVSIGNSESPRELKKRSWSDDLLSAGSRGVSPKEKRSGGGRRWCAEQASVNRFEIFLLPNA
jgi:hypothetical protein